MKKNSRIWSVIIFAFIFLASISMVAIAGVIFNPHADVEIISFPSETIANRDNFFTVVLTNEDVLTGIDSAHETGARVKLELDGGIFKSVELLSASGCDNCFDKYGIRDTSELTIGKSFLAKGSSAVAIVRYSATKESGEITLNATGEVKGPDGYIDIDTATISGTIVTLDYPTFSIKTLVDTADRRGKFYNQSAELLQTVLSNEKTLNEDMQNAWTSSMFWIMGLGAQMFMMPLQEPSTSAKTLLKEGAKSYLDVDGNITDYYLESTFASMDHIIGKMVVDADYRIGGINLLITKLNDMKAATDYEINCWERDPEPEKSYLKLMFKHTSYTMKYNEYDTIEEIRDQAHKLAYYAEQKTKTEGRDVDFFVMTLAMSIEAFANNDLEYIKKCEQLLDDLDNLEDDASNPEFTPLDLCMVLDRSGSMDDPMGDKKKIQGAKEAAADVVDVLLPQDRVSLVSFSSAATTNIDFTSDFSAVKAEINQLSASGGTSFGAGLHAALDQFDTHGNPDHIPAILFMSDGVHTTAPAPDAFVTECKNKKIPIYTVGFASSESDVDVTKLKDMADETGGEYLFADDIFELQNIFIGLQHKASGWESEATYTGEVNQGQTVTAGSFDIAPSTKNSRITLNWPGSDLDLKLLNPDGIPINLSAPDIIYSGDTKPEYVILKEPQPGTWTVRVYGKVVDSSEDYYVLVTEYVPPGSQICKTQITSDPSPQDRPSIVNANGDYYVAYQSWETGSSYNGDIFIKKYDSKWNEVKKEQITNNSYYQDSPSLVFANNELYVALITNHEGATWDDNDVYLKKYDSNLNYISGSGRFLTNLGSYQDLPSLFYKDGYFYLTYSSWESGSSYNGDIYIKKFDSSWNQIKKVRITSETSLQTRPFVIYANGYFYVVYYSKETGNRDIFVKRLDVNLNLDSWKKQITSESSSQSFPSISFADNEYAIVYASYETGTIGIYMKKYDMNWNFIKKTKIVDESSAQERRPSHIWDGSNYFISYVHNYTANDDWNIFTMTPDCNEGQLSQTTPLQVSVSKTPDSVTSGETSQVTIHVRSSADGLPVQGANVIVSAISGSVMPTSGTTDSNGDFKPTYHAPTVTSPTICFISATTSKTGYTSGSGSDTIIVNPQGQTTYSIPLYTGWNLISVPLNLTTWELGDESVVGDPLNITPENCLSSIYRYNTASNLFEKSDHFNDWGWWPATGSESFTKLEPGRGYWVMAKNDCDLTFTGTDPSDMDIELDIGWNLIGWYSMEEVLLGEESVEGNPLNVTPRNSLSSIYRYNTTGLFEKSDHFDDWGWWPATGSESFTKLEPGRGYWVMAKNDCEWRHEV